MTALVGAGLALYLVADLVTRGLALDGLVYASLAKLLAADAGSFWAVPRYDAPGATFYEHPPLGIWLESLWLRLTGDAFWAEKAFAGLCTAACFALTAGLWRALGGGRNVWWPWLLFAAMPVATYTLKNNYLESLLVLAGLAAVWSALRLLAAARVRRRSRWAWSVAFAGWVLAALLVKGPVGLYPLAAPALLGLARPPAGVPVWSPRALLWGLGWTLPALVALLVMLAALGFQDDARVWLEHWWRNQVVASLEGTRPVVHGRLYQLEQLAVNLLGPLLLVGLVRWRTRRRPVPHAAAAMLLLALAASLPLLLSARHFKHYLLPALPLFALGLGLLAQPVVRWRFAPRWTAAVVLLLVGLTAVRGHVLFGRAGNDADEIRAAARVAEAVPAGTVVGFCPAAAGAYALKGYLYRYHGLLSSTGDDAGDGWQVCIGAGGAIDLGDGLELRER